MKKKVDFIIVGQGIAGTWLAFRLLQKNQTFLIINHHSQSVSSRVAAGIINPVLLKRKKLAQNALLLYPNLKKEYSEMEVFLNASFYKNTPITYVIESQEELNNWSILSLETPFKDLIKIIENPKISGVLAPFGLVEIQFSAWVDLNAMLDAFSSNIKEPNFYLNDVYNSEDLISSPNGFVYKDYESKFVLFCQGTAIKDNPLTSSIILKPAKGEVLTIKSEVDFKDQILQQGIFMLPIEKNTYKIGSNFEWNDLSFQTTESAKNEILNKWQKYCQSSFEVIEHKAGIRPSSLDRKPIIGLLQNTENAFIFNGLGSKGVSLAPYYSKMLIDFILLNTPIDPSVDSKRYYKK